jgi:hypothetical protein
MMTTNYCHSCGHYKLLCDGVYCHECLESYAEQYASKRVVDAIKSLTPDEVLSLFSDTPTVVVNLFNDTPPVHNLLPAEVRDGDGDR